MAPTGEIPVGSTSIRPMQILLLIRNFPYPHNFDMKCTPAEETHYTPTIAVYLSVDDKAR